MNPTDHVREFKQDAWCSPARARSYDESTSSTVDYTHFVTTEYLHELTSRIGAGSRVLDLGCGTGVLTKALAALGFEVTGVDISKAMLDQIEQSARVGRITLQQGDVFDLPFGAGTFDGIISRWVIPHFRDWPLIVREAARVLKPGGTLVFDQCSRENYALAATVGVLDHARFGYDPRPHAERNLFYSAASPDELALAANLAGLKLKGIVPLGFFRQNAVFAAALGGEAFNEFRKNLETCYADERIRAFIQWFDREITKHLPLGMVNTQAVVMEKPA